MSRRIYVSAVFVAILMIADGCSKIMPELLQDIQEVEKFEETQGPVV